MKNVGEYIGNYRIVSQQTQTLACQFYRVESNLEEENLFVLKTWPEVSIFSQTGIDTFTQQAQALVDFHAPFVLPIKGYGIDDDSHPYLLFLDEACTLETLARRMERTDVEPILVEEATTILQEVGTALVAAHQQGIVHGSLSPASILLTSEGKVLVADFAPSMVHTMHQRFSLKPAYRPPEMQESRLSDQYALATLAHQLCPQLTISEEEAIARAQSGDPTKRFTSVRKFLLELGIEIALAEHQAEQEIRPAEPPHAKRVSVPTIPWSRIARNTVTQLSTIPWSRIARSKATRWSGLAALLMLFLLGVYLLYTVLPAAAATVTITPMTRSLEHTFQIGTAAQNNLARQQVRGRELQYTTSRQSQSEPAFSMGVVPAKSAHGQLVFSQLNKKIDLSFSSLRIDLSNGLTVITDDRTEMLPGSTYTINAHIQDEGSKGNLPADFVDGFYDVGFVQPIGGTPDFFLENPQPFTGGADSYEHWLVTQDNVNQATSTLEAQLEQQARQAFQSQLQPGEALLDNFTCVSMEQQIQPELGQDSTTSTVTVTEAMNCAVTAYDSKSTYEVALSDMKQFAIQQLGSSFDLVGQLNVLAASSIYPPDATSLFFRVDVQGLWRLLVNTSSRQLLAQTIAGKSQAEARALLLTRFAARTTSLSLTWWWGQHLPEDPKAIQIGGH